MRKTKKLAALMLAGAMAASLAACGGQTASTDTTAAESADGEESKEAEQTADGETYKIGVLQLTQHVALDKTNEGFVAALDDAGIKYEIDQQNAAGEQSACQTIAEKLVNDKDDLIFAIATPAISPENVNGYALFLSSFLSLSRRTDIRNMKNSSNTRRFRENISSSRFAGKWMCSSA